MSEYRIEEDIIGKKYIDSKQMYGLQTVRALNNFDLEDAMVDLSLIYGIIRVKRCAAVVHGRNHKEERDKFRAIIYSCDELLNLLKKARMGEADKISFSDGGVKRDILNSSSEEQRDILNSRGEEERDILNSASEEQRDILYSGGEEQRDILNSRGEGKRDILNSGREEQRDILNSRREEKRDILFRLRELFPLQALQGGAGTSTNMNVNEVLANMALKRLGKKPGQYQYVHPLDDVNRGQSTNDVYPTALRIACIDLIRTLSDACARLQTALQEKEVQWKDIKKLGRTEWMDAVPVTLGEEFGSYAQAISRDRWRIYKVEERLRQVNIGGTAVGLSNTADKAYRFGIIEELRKETGLGLAAAEYPMDLTQNQDVFVEVSGLLKGLAVNLMKIAGDLRIMNSGPFGGIGEVHLKAMQQGSSIMPGKVNPVIPEMTTQCAIQIIANDTAITMAASRGEFELNAFLPLIAHNLLRSLKLAISAVNIFREKAIEPLMADEGRCRQLLDGSYAFATDFISVLGYDKVSHIVKNYPPSEAREEIEKAIEAQMR